MGRVVFEVEDRGLCICVGLQPAEYVVGNFSGVGIGSVGGCKDVNLHDAWVDAGLMCVCFSNAKKHEK